MGERGLAFMPIASGPIVGAGPARTARSVSAIATGTLQAWRQATARKPDALLVTGGYVSAPVAFGARLAGVPSAMFLPDARPGRAASVIARVVDRVLVSLPSTPEHLPGGRHRGGSGGGGGGKARVTGYPVRATLHRRAAAVRELGRTAPPNAPSEHAARDGDRRPRVLFFGGSQGARRINLAVAGAAPALAERADIAHIAGDSGFADAAAARRDLPAAVRARYELHRYLDEGGMADALAWADLVLSRAGAAILGEYPAFGLPSLLVPLPIAAGHQRANADALADAGAARVVEDAELSPARLLREVVGLLDDPERLAGMSRAAAALYVPDAARRIADEMLALAGGHRAGAEA